MITVQYSLEPENSGLLAVLFPQKRIVRDPLPFFVADNELVVVSERIPQVYEHKKVIQISRHAGIKIDTRAGVLEFLKAELSWKVSEEQQKVLESMDEEEFWKLIKLSRVLGHLPKQQEDHFATIFTIFDGMFESFEKSFKAFRLYNGPHRVIFSALLTMMAKTQMTETIGVSAGYKKVLLKNKPYFGLFKMKTMDYLESKMTELDFISFLAGLSEAKRA